MMQISVQISSRNKTYDFSSTNFQLIEWMKKIKRKTTHKQTHIDTQENPLRQYQALYFHQYK